MTVGELKKLVADCDDGAELVVATETRDHMSGMSWPGDPQPIEYAEIESVAVSRTGSGGTRVGESKDKRVILHPK